VTRERLLNPQRTKRYIGIELSGAKSQKTALAAIEYYPKEQKIFLLDIYDKISGHDEQSSDEALLEIVEEELTAVKIGVNVPLSLPPCVACSRQKCPMPGKCNISSVKWMRDASKRAAKHVKKAEKVKDFTPYTQRPVELFLRHQILPVIPEYAQFEIDEALGGTKAPLSARMNFLVKHLDRDRLIEVLPKLSVVVLGMEMDLSKKVISSYRKIEEGAASRSEILEALSDYSNVFIYDRDLQKLAQSLPAFDAFVCAYTALLSDNDHCGKIPHGFPELSGWIEYPTLCSRT